MIITDNSTDCFTTILFILVKESLSTEDVGTLETTHIKLVNFILILKNKSGAFPLSPHKAMNSPLPFTSLFKKKNI